MRHTYTKTISVIQNSKLIKYLVFYPANTNNELFASAHKNSEVLFYTYDSLSTKCKRNCDFHKELTNSLGQLFLDKIIELNLRIELLTTKSTRDFSSQVSQ